jgi:Tol biopolymer transport system component
LRFVAWLALAVPLQAQSFSRISVASSGTQGDGESYGPVISANGRYVFFYSDADNLVRGDVNGEGDVFVRDLVTGAIKLVSTSPLGALGDGESEYPRISDDARFVVFTSDATNLVAADTNGVDDVFVRDLKSGAIVRVSVDSNGNEGLGASGSSYGPAISARGRFVAFYSLAPNLVPDDTNASWDVFVHDLVSHATTRVSVDSAGNEGVNSVLTQDGTPALSADGRFVAFSSDAENLAPNDTNHRGDVFVHDRKTGETQRVSVSSSGAQGRFHCSAASLSADGRTVAFLGGPDLAPGASGGSNIYVHDLLNGTTSLVSATYDGLHQDGASTEPSISRDGRYVAFTCSSSNIVPGDTNGRNDLFLRDLAAGTSTRLSLTEGGAEPSRSCYMASMSADRHTIAFWSAAPEFVKGDTNEHSDIFVRYDGQRAPR